MTFVDVDRSRRGPEEERRPTTMLVACHACGLVHRIPELPDGDSALCTRCGSVLFRRKRDSIERALALTIASLALFTIAVTFPLMTMKMAGNVASTSLIKGVTALYHEHMEGLAVLVGLVAIIFPLTRLLGFLYVLICARTGRHRWVFARVFRIVQSLAPWAMTEVYLLGLIVAWVKLKDLASLELGPALFALVGLIITMTWAGTALEPHEIWERVTPQRRRFDGPDDALLSCHSCHQLVPKHDVEDQHHARCPRCGAALHTRKPNSITRVWALIVAAMILYIPANLLPVMQITSLGTSQGDTILSGVKELIGAGMWPVALLVFFASITVPVLKIIGLIYLLVTTQRRSVSRRRERTKMYKIIEFVGRWSMVDVFMISILVALVNLGALATIQPGPGAAAFASVVILTMIAAGMFDSRLIWDGEEQSHGDRH